MAGYVASEFFGFSSTVKPVLCSHSKRSKLVFNADYRFMQVKSIAECSKGSILQYFRPSLCYHLSLRSALSNFEWLLKTGFTVFISYIKLSVKYIKT